MQDHRGSRGRFYRKKKLKKDKTVVIDTTVAPVDIAFPTDITLLEKSRRVMLRIIKRFAPEKKFRTYSRTARKTFLTYIKLGRKKRTKTRRVHGKMIRFALRNFKQAREALKSARNKAGDSPEHREIEAAEAMLNTIEKVIEQQSAIHKQTGRNGSKQGIRVKDRIVSLFRPHVRPMSRGKIPQPTEFGPKLLLEMRSGFVTVLRVSWDNIADSEVIKEFFGRWKGLALGGDRAFHSPANTRLAKEAGVKKYYIEKKGKKSHAKSTSLKRVRSKRAAIEQKIGLAKRAHGLNRIRYRRGMDGEEQWIRLSIAAMNMKRALRLSFA